MIDTVHESELVSNIPASDRTRIPPWHGRRGLDELDVDGQFEQCRDAVLVARRWVRQWHEGPRPTRGLLMYGPVGTGKSTVACALAVDLGEPDGCLYRDLRESLATAKAQFNGDDDGLEVKRLVRANPLVLDDIGKPRRTEWAVETLRDVVERRYDRGLSTIATSNLELDQLEVLLGSAAYSRLRGSTYALRVSGTDLRRL